MDYRDYISEKLAIYTFYLLPFFAFSTFNFVCSLIS